MINLTVSCYYSQAHLVHHFNLLSWINCSGIQFIIYSLLSMCLFPLSISKELPLASEQHTKGPEHCLLLIIIVTAKKTTAQWIWGEKSAGASHPVMHMILAHSLHQWTHISENNYIHFKLSCKSSFKLHLNRRRNILDSTVFESDVLSLK